MHTSCDIWIVLFKGLFTRCNLFIESNGLYGIYYRCHNPTVWTGHYSFWSLNILCECVAIFCFSGQSQKCSGEYNGHCYLLIDRRLTWDEGRKACVDDTGMDMAVITDANEQDFVAETIKQVKCYLNFSFTIWVEINNSTAFSKDSPPPKK